MTATGSATRSCGWRTWTWTGCGLLLDLRPRPAHPLHPRARHAVRLLRGVERLGHRGVQRLRSRPAVAPSRSCPATRPRPRWPSSNGWPHSATVARSSTCSTSMPATRRGTPAEPPPSRTVCRSASTSRRGLVRLSYQVGNGQSAAFATPLPLQLDGRWPSWLLRALERHPGLTRVWPRPVSAGFRISEPDGHGVGAPPGQYRLCTFGGAQPAVQEAGHGHLREEALAYQYIPHLGADSCMWAADFPHTDSTFPESRRSIEETLGMLPEEDRRKITALNCASSTASTMRPRPFPPCSIIRRTREGACPCS